MAAPVHFISYQYFQFFSSDKNENKTIGSNILNCTLISQKHQLENCNINVLGIYCYQNFYPNIAYKLSTTVSTNKTRNRFCISFWKRSEITQNTHFADNTEVSGLKILAM